MSTTARIAAGRAGTTKSGQDEVDAEVLVAREREPGVDDDDLAAVLVDGHVLADLAEAAERDDAQCSRAGSVCAPAGRRRLGRGGASRPSRRRGSRGRGSRSSSVGLDERQPVAADVVAEQVQRGLDRDRVADDAQELDRRARAPRQRARALDVAGACSGGRAPSPAGRRRACGRRCRRRRRARGTAGSGRRRRRRGRGRSRRCAAPARGRRSPA